jgi:hypothetical protein
MNANWLELTDAVTKQRIWVNMARIVAIEPGNNCTHLRYGVNDSGGLNVAETPGDIFAVMEKTVVSRFGVHNPA